MRLHGPSFPQSSSLVLFLLFLTPIIYAAPSSTPHAPKNHVPPPPHSPNPPTSALFHHNRPPPTNLTTTTTPLSKRSPPFSHATIANGWQIHYRIMSLILPAAPALLDLRRFYNAILDEVSHRIITGDVASAVIEPSLGRYTLQFIAERGFDTLVHWEIVEAFVEKMLLESTVPATFMAHIAPPESDVGIVIKMWVAGHT